MSKASWGWARTAPVAIHVGDGMYGLILVEPKEGLAKVDHEYYVMQGDFYTQGRKGEKGLQPFSMEKVIDEKPEHIVFNGSVGSRVGDKALTAKVGETVWLFVGDGRPNVVSSFHVIGRIFDAVYPEGAMSMATHNVQTTTVPAGGSAIGELKMSVPGAFVIGDHSLERAYNRGALAQLKVAEPEDKLVYSGKQSDFVYQPEGAGVRVATGDTAVPAPAARTRQERIEADAAVFADNCQACRQADGQAVLDAFPPLAQSDCLNGDKVRAIRTATGGQVMPAWSLSDEDIANVLTYVDSKWGDSGEEVTPTEVNFNRVKAQ